MSGINVTITSTSPGVSIGGGTSVSVAVSGPSSPVSVGMVAGGSTSLPDITQLTAGTGITISTAANQFLISSYSTAQIATYAGTSKVTSVAGRTGTITLSAADVSGLSAVATSGSASDLTVGTLPAALLPAATTATLGAVQVGSGLAVANGVLSATGGGGGASLSDATPSALGTAAAGTSSAASRADHVHALPTASAIGAANTTHTHDAANITTGTLASARLPLATTGAAGAVIVGSGLSVSNGTLSAASSALTTAPLSPTGSGTAGTLAYDEYGYLYLCYQTNKWRKFSPSAPLTWPAYTIALFHFDGGTLADSSGTPLTMAIQGSGGTLSTTQSKFGGSALRLTGSSYVQAYEPTNAGIADFGTAQDFTVEMFVRFDSVSVYQPLFMSNKNPNGPYAGNFHFAFLPSDTSPSLVVHTYMTGTYDRAFVAWSPSANTWYHIAVERQIGMLRVFIDGVEQSSDNAFPFDADYEGWTGLASDGISLGAGGTYGNEKFTGYIDEFRMSRVARYDGNFTPRTTAFPN